MKCRVILAMTLTLTTLGCSDATRGSSSRLLHDAEAVASSDIQVMNQQNSQYGLAFELSGSVILADDLLEYTVLKSYVGDEPVESTQVFKCTYLLGDKYEYIAGGRTIEDTSELTEEESGYDALTDGTIDGLLVCPFSEE